MKWQGWSANNIAFGCGGGLLQQMDRDTHKFAFKCSAIERADGWHDVYKTATGKASKRGRLSLIQDSGGQFATCPYDEDNLNNDALKDRFHNGFVYNEPNLDDIRRRAKL
jgi:nicotinamide phosphoribosyltransferase